MRDGATYDQFLSAVFMGESSTVRNVGSMLDSTVDHSTDIARTKASAGETE